MFKIIAIILIFSVLLFGIGYYFYNLNNFNLMKNNVKSVSISQEMVDLLNQKYIESEDEFLLCLSGEIINDTAVIKNYHSPKEFVSNGNNIIFRGCRNIILDPLKTEKHLGTIHNHPSGVCRLGENDIYTFGRTNDVIIGIICGEDNINFFTSKDLIDSVNLIKGGK